MTAALLSAAVLSAAVACAPQSQPADTPAPAPARNAAPVAAASPASRPVPPVGARSTAALALGLPRPQTGYTGAAALGLALRRVGPTQRVLMVGAHPDDENTAVLAELALGRGADVAYLSLTRGEGGQNLIGGELDEALGLIRTGELLAARRLDGAVQFFTRAYDFGFSKTAEETFEHWPRDSVLADVVEVVRLWRPDVVISIFSGTPRDGHGHHQAAGILAREAYRIAGDPDRFTGQLARGLAPHAPARLYQSLWRPRPGEATLTLETGDLDPLLGRSRFQIAMASRSRHRSQDMGQAQPIGPRQAALKLLHARDGSASAAPTAAATAAPASQSAAERGLFVGLDTALTQRARRSGATPGLLSLLERYDRAARSLPARFNPLAGGALVAPLRSMVATLDSAMASAQRLSSDLGYHILSERRDAADALALAAGVVLTAETDRRIITPGDSVRLTLSLWNGGAEPLPVEQLEPELGYGWWAETDDERVQLVAPASVATRTFTVHAPERPPAGPYFLERARTDDLYTWPDRTGLRARPFGPPDLTARALVLDGVPVEAEATHVAVDPAYGERRMPLVFAPDADVSLEPSVAPLVLGSDRPVRLALRLRSFEPEPIAGRIEIGAPTGWNARALLTGDGDTTRAALPLEWSASPGGGTLLIELVPGAGVDPGEYEVAARFHASGRSHTLDAQLVDYEHLRPRLLLRPAAAQVRALDVDVPPNVRVGYVPGAGDDVPQALAALGVPLDTVSAGALRSGDLAAYDVLLTGIRAYEVRDVLAEPAVRARLREYVERGGALVVQYNKYPFVDEGHALLPMTMSRPHDRVTDEAADVRLLEPEHPLLSRPNRIGPADWRGWVQERGLYFADTWDDAYTPLLEMADAGEPPQRGALLAARVGDGWYVYTGLALFRQLPAGVPGAYRLLANLVALGAD